LALATAINARPWLIVALGLACQDTEGPNRSVPGVASIEVVAVSMVSIRLRWVPVGGDEIIGYRLERRANLTGEFAVVQSSIPQSNATEIVFFDTGLEPETYYGYRVVAQSRFGELAEPSLVRAALTPPQPAVLVTTSSILATPAAGDADGFMAVVRGASDSARIPMGAQGQARFGPLSPGAYTVQLRGIAPQCAIDGSPQRNAIVTDQGVRTVDTVRYVVLCRDPGLGRITAVVAVTGDSLDASGYAVQLVGRPTSGPDSIVSLHYHVNPAGGQRTFDLLHPGLYELSIDSIASHCPLAGSPLRNVTVAPLSDDTVRYSIACQGGGDGGGSGPYAWRNVWSASSVPSGQRVSLDITLDLSADPTERVAATEAQLRYDPAVLRYDSASARSLGQPTVNSSTPGVVLWNTLTLNTPPGGVVPLVQFHFTAVGTNGMSTATRTVIDVVADANLDELADSLFRTIEDTVTVGSGGANQAPNAEANGPYNGPANTAIAFTAAGSSDPDGTIATYSWTFGDGGTATGVTPSHTYTAAGTYTATLTVTDNQGATDTDQATVTVTPAGGNQPPVAEANGPYSGTPGTPITFSATGSSDPDGTIASYDWTFGDGGSAPGATASHTYGAGGVYAAVLTVTDNQGATDTDQATVTVTGGGQTTPFTWAGSFGAVTPADSIVALTLTLDLSTDIPETPGIEELAQFGVDSLKWNPAVLRFHAFNWGPGGAGVTNPTDALTQGKLSFASFTLPPTNNTGVIIIAVIRFKVIAPAGTTTTATSLGHLTGTAATGSYAYRPRTIIQEATFP
jgi:PKD repeat protein